MLSRRPVSRTARRTRSYPLVGATVALVWVGTGVAGCAEPDQAVNLGEQASSVKAQELPIAKVSPENNAVTTRPDAEVRIFLDSNAATYPRFRQQFVKGALAVTVNGTPAIANYDATGDVVTVNHALLRRYTRYDVVLSVKAAAQSASSKSANAQYAFGFTTGSALHEATHLKADVVKSPLPIPESGEVAVRLTDDYGLPATNARVTLASSSTTLAGPPLLALGETNQGEGSLEFTDRVAETVALTVTSQDNDHQDPVDTQTWQGSIQFVEAGVEDAELKPLEVLDDSKRCMYLLDVDRWDIARDDANRIWKDGESTPRPGLTVADILRGTQGELNRTAGVLDGEGDRQPPAHPEGSWGKGYMWAEGDQITTEWIPQGMTLGTEQLSSGEDPAVNYALVAWYRKTDIKAEADVRVSIVKLDGFSPSEPQVPTYRHALLVEPAADGTFQSIGVHAGGAAVRRGVDPRDQSPTYYLYLADTKAGLRVFDLNNIREVNTNSDCDGVLGRTASHVCAKGYRYVIPQVNSYLAVTDTDDCMSLFSFLGTDAADASAPAILSGEYCKESDGSCAHGTGRATSGRLFRWPVDPQTGRLKTRTDTDTVVAATKAYVMNKRNVQGVAPVPWTADKDDYLLSSTRFEGSLFYVNATEAWKAYTVKSGNWSYYSQNLYVLGSSPANYELWADTEGKDVPPPVSPRAGGRCLYSLAANALAITRAASSSAAR